MKLIKTALESFESIDLLQIDKVKLMDRVDVKYIIPIDKLGAILEQCANSYNILKINNSLIHAYSSTYYDTLQYDFYYANHAGKLSRNKVRTRTYLTNDLHFLELKHKNNKRRTEKIRIQLAENADLKQPECQQFLNKSIGNVASVLNPTLTVDYQRFTLINLESKERVTIDMKVSFSNDTNTYTYQNFAIAEIKQEESGRSFFGTVVKAANLRAGSINKYCMGLITLQPSLKHNRFKSRMLHIKKIENQ